MARTGVSGRRRRSLGLPVLAIAACAALLVGDLGQAHGAARAAESGATPLVGGFAIGDGLEAMIQEADGSFSITVPVGGIDLGWDSRAVSAGDRFRLGAGWGLRLGYLDTKGGVRVMPASSSEPFEADASAPSGLHGYTLEDVRFSPVDPSALPGRADGAPSQPHAAAFALHELGGQTTYFDSSGDPIARITALGDRTDWHWSEEVPHRLERVVDPDGVITDLDWQSEPDALVVHTGVNLPAEANGADRTWRVEFARTRAIAAVRDPSGGRLEFRYAGRELTSIAGESGATTSIEWQRSDDQVSRVSRVQTRDTEGAALSTRTWRPLGSASPSGWPAVETDSESQAAGGPGYRTILSDEVTSVRSHYSAQHVLQSKEISTLTPQGEQRLQRQVFSYPSGGGARAGAPASGSAASRPIAAEAAWFDASGGSRVERAEFEYDALGRVTRELAGDGTVTETSYDDVVPPGREVAVGLVTRTRTTTADGFVREVSSELDEARTSVVARETVASDGDPVQQTLTERIEYTVRSDGFVTEQRVFPVGEDEAGAEPLVTRWSSSTDLATGALTTTETVGVGTDAEATTSEKTSLLHGGVLAATDVFGNESTTDYDVLGRAVATTDVGGNTTVTAYETWQADGRNATVVTGADDVVTTEIRDELGRVAQRSDNIDRGVATDGHVRVVEKFDHGVPGTVTVTDAWGATASVTKDPLGRIVRTVRPTGLVEVTEYDDAAERVTTGLTPTGRLIDAQLVSTERRERDERTTRSIVSRADGMVVPEATERLDGLGRPSAATDGFVRTTAKYDPWGRPATTTTAAESGSAAGDVADEAAHVDTDGSPLRAELEFDAFGNGIEKRLADGAGATSGGRRVVDGLGRTRAETDLGGRTREFEYSLDGLVTRSARDDGQETRNEYDPATRALTRSVTTSPIGAAVETAYEYDARTGRLLAVYDPRDRAASEIRYTYDAHGNTLTTTYPDGTVVRHGYDANGRPTTTEAAGLTTELEYDAAGSLVAAVQFTERGDEVARVGYAYDEFDRLVTLSRGNGVVTELTYTSADEIETETTTSGDRVIADRSYTYDARGLLTERIDVVADDEGAATRTISRYRYDERERLVESSVHDGDLGELDVPGAEAQAEPIQTTAYELSTSGDITAETVTVRADGVEHARTRRFEYTPAGELVALTDDAGRREQRYDSAGNLVRSADGTTFTYDAANRPVSETARDGSVIDTRYWVDGSRRSLSTAGSDGTVRSIEFTWDGADLLGETHRGGDQEATVAYLVGAARHARTMVSGGGPVAASSTVYYGTDRHRNVTELTAADGNVSERYAYSDYGVEVARGAGGVAEPSECGAGSIGEPARNPFRYSGEHTDPTCRQYLAARVYDAAMTRFTTMDVAAVMNPFAYTDANPITRVDPTGNSSEDDDGARLTPAEWGWNFAVLVISAAGLVGTGLSFLAPLKAYKIAMLLIAGAADLVALVSSSVRWGLQDQIDAPTADVFNSLNTLTGAAIVGIGFGAWAIWKRSVAQRAAIRQRKALNTFRVDTPGPRFDPGSPLNTGRGTAPQLGERSRLLKTTRPYGLKTSTRSTHPRSLVSQDNSSSLGKIAELPLDGTRPMTSIPVKSATRARSVPSSAAHERPAARVTQTGPNGSAGSATSKPGVEPPVGRPSSASGADPRESELLDVLDFTSTSTTRWPVALVP